MGSCLSKKGSSSTPVTPPAVHSSLPVQPTVLPIRPAARSVEGNVVIELPRRDQDNVAAGQGNFTKKEVFLIKHWKSHDRESQQISPLEQKLASGIAVAAAAKKAPDEVAEAAQVASHPMDNHDKLRGVGTAAEATGMRTSSCTKEEVDAILIQCGRLSRSSSGNFGGRSYSGSKRSYDFDNHDGADGGVAVSVSRGRQFSDLNEDDPGRRRSHRRQSRPSPTRDHGGRRRTPSRERDQQRSSSASRERRMSCSPGRRADNTTNASLSNALVNSGGSKLPAKMVSVPATVTGTEKTKSNLEPKAAAVRRISVKRNQGAGDTTRAAASSRSQSPVKQTTSIAKAADNGSQQPQLALSRSSSRKAEKSPYRRNPLGEIDPNTFPHPQPAALLANHKYYAPANKENEAPQVKEKLYVDKWKSEMTEATRSLEEGKAAAQSISQMEPIVQASTAVEVDLEDVHRTLASVKSSQEVGFEKDRQGSYTSLLLQDIQKFHQNQAGPSFSLPPCVVKACSIYDAVAGLTSKRSCIYDDSTAFSCRINTGTSFNGAKSEAKDPFVESELAVDDDLVEPSILKYVTIKRGGMLGREEEEQESSGSNTLFLGSTGAEPGLADSPNCGTSISASTQTNAISDKVYCMDDSVRRMNYGRMQNLAPVSS